MNFIPDSQSGRKSRRYSQIKGPMNLREAKEYITLWLNNDEFSLMGEEEKQKYHNLINDCSLFDNNVATPKKKATLDNGIIDILDVVLSVNIVLGLTDSNPAADVNGDGVINVLDIILLINIILGVD